MVTVMKFLTWRVLSRSISASVVGPSTSRFQLRSSLLPSGFSSPLALLTLLVVRDQVIQPKSIVTANEVHALRPSRSCQSRESVSSTNNAAPSRRTTRVPSISSAGCSFQQDASGGNDGHQLVPRLHERLRTLVLKLSGKPVYVDAMLGETR
jgi:hypothetical protein